ncbi:hypothetical protein NPIL_677571 [Nephila pilipes]|uniref:Uncharacterized protein n=1 Tax=Nephila pilipes TaxID=299642 RepID=A0A8X6PIC0_NEPPI|nr:hypothetical protein NPIL_677571 [Nephila pilipes]
MDKAVFQMDTSGALASHDGPPTNSPSLSANAVGEKKRGEIPLTSAVTAAFSSHLSIWWQNRVRKPFPYLPHRSRLSSSSTSLSTGEEIIVDIEEEDASETMPPPTTSNKPKIPPFLKTSKGD